jgi:hypothetical protein
LDLQLPVQSVPKVVCSNLVYGDVYVDTSLSNKVCQ